MGSTHVPGAGGTLWKLDKNTGKSALHINPFAGTNVVPANTFVAGPLTADVSGNIYYNVLWLSDFATADPWTASDVLGAGLVKVTPQDNTSTAAYDTLVPGAPAGNSNSCPAALLIRIRYPGRRVPLQCRLRVFVDRSARE
jgi:hypothetical protein